VWTSAAKTGTVGPDATTASAVKTGVDSRVATDGGNGSSDVRGCSDSVWVVLFISRVVAVGVLVRRRDGEERERDSRDRVSDVALAQPRDAVRLPVPASPKDKEECEALSVTVSVSDRVTDGVPACPRDRDGREALSVMVRAAVVVSDCVDVLMCPRDRDGREALLMLVIETVAELVGGGHTPVNGAGRSTETDGTTTAGSSNAKMLHELTGVVVPVMLAPLTRTTPSVTVVPEMFDWKVTCELQNV